MTAISTTPSPTRSASPLAREAHSERWPRIPAEALVAVREPLAWRLGPGELVEPGIVAGAIRQAAAGPVDDTFVPPSWLMPHQVSAAKRLAGSLAVFGGALLADAVGLGKTYVSLALAGRRAGAVAVVPSSLRPQWRRVADSVGVPIQLTTHEALSRGAELPSASFIVVDEAHRFRNPLTKRYRALARGVGSAPVLLVSATPVVNQPSDLLHLLRIVLPDDGLALLGVPSLQEALEARAFDALTHAAQALVVARSTRLVAVHLPRVRDLEVLERPPLEDAALGAAIHTIEQLKFPNVGARAAKQLMRLCLLARLASSGAALRESLRRHLGYLDVAADAATRGEAVSRRAARLMTRELAELQFELNLPLDRLGPVLADHRAITEERARMLDLLDQVCPTASDPKASALERLLNRLGGRKAIVFTGAVPTALALARRLGWRRVAVVGGGRGRIASGPIGVERALALFAPRARGAAPPGETERVDTLIATDLASEGLDLQDAEAVIHYDLPWTPLRLAQRIGRLARLGSCHSVVTAAWFAPVPALDSRLALVERLARKAAAQLHCPVSATSVPGRAALFNQRLEMRERLAAGSSASPAHTAHAFVSGPVSVAVLEWRVRDGAPSIPEVIALPRAPDGVDLSGVAAVMNRSAVEPHAAHLEAALSHLLGVVRDRLATAGREPQDPMTRHLRRLVLRRAQAASRARSLTEITSLDRVLAVLGSGVRREALWELHDLWPAGAGGFDRWAERWARSRERAPTVWLRALLIGVE